MPAPYTVIFVCTGNSCRSQMAEALLRYMGQGRFIARSAGSHPASRVHPLAIETMRRMGVPMEGQHPKSWKEVSARPEDIVITVCDAAATQLCPVLPGHETTAHWSLPDPTFVSGSEEDRLGAAGEVARTLQRWLSRLIALPIDALSPDELRRRLQQIADA